MKAPRDILVAGIGFLLGMVFCYFLMASKSAPKMGNIAVFQVPANRWPTPLLPNGYQKPIRIEPLYGPGPTPDLIDLDYVPDFKIELE